MSDLNQKVKDCNQVKPNTDKNNSKEKETKKSISTEELVKAIRTMINSDNK